jgi:uncharacterized membrane protein YtjA (UPF0391 family)
MNASPKVSFRKNSPGGRSGTEPASLILCKVNSTKGTTMLSWAITFLVVALIAAVLGFGGIAGTAAGIAKILFAVFLVLFVISLLFGRRAV